MVAVRKTKKALPKGSYVSEDKGRGKKETKGAARKAVALEDLDPKDATEREADGTVDGTGDIPEAFKDAMGNFKMMPVPRQLGALHRRRTPLAVIVGMAGCGKSRLGSALMGNREFRVVFEVGVKTTKPKIIIGETISVLDTPGLPDPFPQSSDAYYNDTVLKLRSVGYANAVLFVVNSERVTPTLIKNYGILYRAFNKLTCAKMFVIRRETSFLTLGLADQAVNEAEARRTVESILEATNLKRWKTKEFFMWTDGSGDEQDKQVAFIRSQVRAAPRVDITDSEGLQLTSEALAASAARRAEEEALALEEAAKGKKGKKGKKATKKPPAAAAPVVTAAAVPDKSSKKLQKTVSSSKKADDSSKKKEDSSKKVDDSSKKKEDSSDSSKRKKSGCCVM